MEAPSTQEFELKDALEALNTMGDDDIPWVFEAMPPQVQMNEDFIKMALEKCAYSKIDELFSAMPDEKKRNDAVVKMAFDKCWDANVPELFRAMPDEVKTKVDFATTALEKCRGDEIPNLFKAMPAEMQRSEAIVKMALEKCRDDYIPSLFQAMPDEVKTNKDFVKMALDRCFPGDFQFASRIPELFRAMPAEVHDAVIQTAFKRCSNAGIPKLFDVMPAGVQMKDHVLKIAWENCLEDQIPELCKVMLAIVQRNARDSKACVKKVVAVVDSIDALNGKALQGFHTCLPADLQDDEKVKSAFERKKVSQLPFLQKYKKLLRAAGEVSITYLLVFGSIEGAIWCQKSAGGKIQNLSNQHWKNKADFEEVHFEIFEGCVLSAAPQPFDLTLPLTSLKLVVITVAFGFISRNLMTVKDNQEERWKVWMAVGMMVYSVIMIPISFISLVVHYVQEVSPQIPGSFKKYECFFAIVNLAPFQSNYLMFLAQYFAGFTVSKSAAIFDIFTEESVRRGGPERQKIEDNVREGNVSPATSGR